MLFITVLAFLRLYNCVQLSSIHLYPGENIGSNTGPILGIANVIKTQVLHVNYSLLGPLLDLIWNFVWRLYCNLFSFVLSVSLWCQ